MRGHCLLNFVLYKSVKNEFGDYIRKGMMRYNIPFKSPDSKKIGPQRVIEFGGYTFSIFSYKDGSISVYTDSGYFELERMGSSTGKFSTPNDEIMEIIYMLY